MTTVLASLVVAEGEIGGGTLFDRPFGPHSSAVPLNDSLNRGEAYTGTEELRGFVQSLEGSKQAVGVARIKSGSIIA